MEEIDLSDKASERKGKLTLVLALAILISTFGSSFQYGYNVAVVNSPAPVMQEFYNQTYYDRYGNPIEDSYLTLLWSLSVSMFPLGGFFGSLMVAPLVNKLGRKGTLLFNNIFSIVPAVLMGASEAAKSYEIIIAARFLVGICAGLSSSVVPMYLGEISPKNLRGAIGIVPQLFITIGILVAQIFGIRSILGNTRGWTLMLALTGIPAVMQEFYNQTYYDRYGNPIEDSYLTLLWSLSVSMFPLGGFFGSLMVAPLVNKLGRKGTLLINNIFSIVPAVLMGASEAAKSYEIIIAARFLIGICAGLSSNVVPMYLGEISPKNLRGAIGIVPQLFITIGILVAQIFGIRSMLGNTRGWTLMLALTGIPAVIELVFLPFFPESPRYMLIQKGDEEKARKALQRLRGWEDVDSEMEEMRLEEQSEKAEGCLSVLNLCSFPSLRWQLISITVMNMGQQLSGVNAIYYYADSIYGSAGVKESAVQYVTVGTGSVNVFMTIAAVFIVEASGRKLLLLIGFGICGAACVVLTIALTLQGDAEWMPYLSIACVIVYIIGHAIGPSPIPYVVTTEMFRQSSRPAAFMVAGSVHWLSNFTVGLVFPFMEKGLGTFSFIIFGAICLATLGYIFIVVPETKNKTFLEVSQLLAKRNKTEIAVGSGSATVNDLKPMNSETDAKEGAVDMARRL
ncbi:UNVERIFIED_CONTAM: hypothetical protein FKN15_014817 [Acipenser sinensis]